MTSTTDLGLSIRLSMFELRETGDWGIFLGPPLAERARAVTGGADQWVLKRREFPKFAKVNKVLPHPWDTHYQFSIKLYSQKCRRFGKKTMPQKLNM